MLRNFKTKNLHRMVVVAAALAAGTVLAAGARAASITSNNSSLTINPSGSSLPFISNWVVDGVDQYGGSPAGGEDLLVSIGSSSGLVALSSLPLMSSPSFSDGIASVTYKVSGSGFAFTVAVTEMLTGENPGSGGSGINETIKVTNTESSTVADSPLLEFNLVDGLDLNVNGTPNKNTLTLSPSIGTNTANQTVPSGAQVNYVAAPTPNLFDTIDRTTSTSSPSLGPVTGVEGFEARWDLSIPAGDSKIISIDETLTGGRTSPVVPLPNSAVASLATLTGLGMIRIVRRMRRTAI